MARNVIILLCIALICIMFSKTINTSSLPMIPIDSPRLQIFPQNLTFQQRLELLKNITFSRASLHSSRSRKKSSSNVSTNSIVSTLHLMPNNYYATEIYFGATNNLYLTYLLLDSGGDNTWIQCEGCNPCFELKGGSIPIQNSPTYKRLSKDDPRCNPQMVIDNDWCAYRNEYPTGASTSGPFGTETLMFLDSEDETPEYFDDVAFGCGLANDGIDFGPNTGPNNIIAGIFGIAPGPQSFLTQLDATMKGRFSYCLTSWDEPNEGISTLYYGDSADIGTGTDVRTIKMNSDGLYHLYFRGISVDGKRLPNIDASICPLNVDELDGFIIDSGAPVTALPQSAYQQLRDAMIAFFDRYGWAIVEAEFFDLCYALPPGVIMDDQPFPSVVFHFENGDGSGSEVDWELPRDNMFAYFNSIHGFCMTAAEYPDDCQCCLFGATQQSNFNVLYDVKNSKLSFKPQRCQENT